jgi:predicted permease
VLDAIQGVLSIIVLILAGAWLREGVVHRYISALLSRLVIQIYLPAS